MDEINLVLVGLALFVAMGVVITGMDTAFIDFTTSARENLTVNEYEWFEHGYWDEEMSDAELVEDEDGWLVMEDFSSGDVAVWRSDVFDVEESHSVIDVRGFTENIRLQTPHTRTVTLQLYEVTGDGVMYETVLVEGRNVLDVGIEPDTAYEIMLEFNAGQSSPRMRSLEYNYLARYFSGFTMEDFSYFVLVFLLAVVVGAVMKNK